MCAALQRFPLQQQRVRLPGVRQVLPGEGAEHACLHAQRAARAPCVHQPAHVPSLLLAGFIRGIIVVDGSLVYIRYYAEEGTSNLFPPFPRCRYGMYLI